MNIEAPNQTETETTPKKKARQQVSEDPPPVAKEDIKKLAKSLNVSVRALNRKANEQEDIKLPIAEASEKSILGLFLMWCDGDEEEKQNQVFRRALEAGLCRDHFAIPSNKTIFNAMNTLFLKGTVIHPVSIKEYLHTQHKLEEVGGVAYLGSLIDEKPFGPAALSSVVEQLKTVGYKRAVLKKAVRLQEMAQNGASPTDIEELLDSVERTNITPTPYAATPQGMIQRKPSKYGYGLEGDKLANFNAKIVSEQIETDGSLEEQRVFEIECELNGRKFTIRVPSSKFTAMAWPTAMLGAEAIVYPGKEGQARCAIQSLSRNIRQMTVYTHTGWREIDGKMSYLHSGGAITPEGNRTDVTVRLPDSLRLFFLPEPPDLKKCQPAFQAVLDLMTAFPLSHTVPMLGSILGSVLGSVNYSFYITGTSGTFKSELTAIGQSFFGSGFDSQHFPANWNDTVNSILAKMFAAKDSWMVIDDFVPIGQKSYDDKLHAKAEVVFRAAANRSGRGRANVDGSDRSSKEPRCLAASSGEDLPKGGSLQNRLLIDSIKPGDIDPKTLTIIQQMSRAGRFAEAMAAFIHFIASDYANIIEAFNKDRLALRDNLLKKQANKGHTRQPTTLTHLAASWRVWLKAAVARKAMTEKDAKKHWATIWRTLVDTVESQKKQQSTKHVAEHFIDLVTSALSSNAAHLMTPDNDEPDDSGTWGWFRSAPMGKKIGWIDNDIVYLEMATAWSVANMMGLAAGEGLQVGPKALTERLDEKGLIAVKTPSRGNKARPPKIKVDCVAISANTFYGEGRGEILVPTVPTVPETAKAKANR